MARLHTVPLNSKSYVAGIVEKMSGWKKTTDDLVTVVRKGLQEQAVASAPIFGSIAHGDETPLSDVDLFMMTEDREKAEAAVSETHGDVSSILSKLDLYDVEEAITDPYQKTGPGKTPGSTLGIFKAFVIKHLENIPSYREFYRRLWSDEMLRDM